MDNPAGEAPPLPSTDPAPSASATHPELLQHLWQRGSGVSLSLTAPDQHGHSELPGRTIMEPAGPLQNTWTKSDPAGSIPVLPSPSLSSRLLDFSAVAAAPPGPLPALSDRPRPVLGLCSCRQTPLGGTIPAGPGL